MKLKWILFAVVVVVTIVAAGIAYYHKEWATMANVAILGVTAMVVVFYTHETQKLGTSTENMAKATREMAEQQCSANLVPVFHPKPVVGPGQWRDELLNEGTGAAYDVTVDNDCYDQPLHWPRIEGRGVRPLPPHPKNSGMTITYLAGGRSYSQTWLFTEDFIWVLADDLEGT